jgi:hypothetical protein
VLRVSGCMGLGRVAHRLRAQIEPERIYGFRSERHGFRPRVGLYGLYGMRVRHGF